MVSRIGTHAVTLNYNPMYGGTAFPGYRIVQGEPVLVPSSIRRGSFSMRAERRSAEAKRLCKRETITMPTVLKVPLETVHSDLNRLHARIDHTLYGSRYHRRPAMRRTGYIGFIEHENSNIHVHLAWRVPEDRTNEFSKVVTKEWSTVHAIGTIVVKPVRDEGWANYMIKVTNDVVYGDAALFVASTTGAA